MEASGAVAGSSHDSAFFGTTAKRKGVVGGGKGLQQTEYTFSEALTRNHND